MNKHCECFTDNLTRAVASIILAVFALSVGDAMIKALSLSFPLWQLFVLRSLMALALLLVVIKLINPIQPIVPQSKGWVTLRSILLTLQWIAYYAALPSVNLSVAGAAFYTIPLFITIFSALLSNDKITTIGWLAIITGFIGVLIMLRPNTDDFNKAALLPLIAAILYALAMVMTRIKCQEENPFVLGFNLHMTIFATGAIATLIIPVLWPNALQTTGNAFIFGDWTDMQSSSWLAMGGLALAAVIGAVAGAYAYQKGASATVASFDYFYLAFITLWGVLFFSELPDVWTVLGMLLIVVAGITSVRHSSD